MPNNYSAALKDHLASQSATVAIGCKMTRPDGFVIGMTNHMRSVTINSLLYRAQPGLLPSALMSKLDFAIDNAEIQGFIQDDAISDSDLRGGLWDGSEMEFFVYNYNDLSMGTGFFGKGYIGNVSIMSNGMWGVEFRSLEQLLAQEIGELTSATCRYKRLGHDGCPVNVAGTDALGRPITRTGTITSVTDRQTFTVSGLSGVPNGFFKEGVVTFTGGQNDGFKGHVQSFAAGVFTLYQEMPLPIEVGDTISAEEGCDRRIETCSVTFGVAWAFDGEPGIPGPDNVFNEAGDA